jgi:hypothetical protein
VAHAAVGAAGAADTGIPRCTAGEGVGCAGTGGAGRTTALLAAAGTRSVSDPVGVAPHSNAGIVRKKGVAEPAAERLAEHAAGKRSRRLHHPRLADGSSYGRSDGRLEEAAPGDWAGQPPGQVVESVVFHGSVLARRRGAPIPVGSGSQRPPAGDVRSGTAWLAPPTSLSARSSTLIVPLF